MGILNVSLCLLAVALAAEASTIPASVAEASSRIGIAPFSQTLEGRDNLGIFNGYDASPGDFPHQVALFEKLEGFFCSGGILSTHWIITAGHCVDWTNADFEVRAGIYKLDQTGDDVQSRQTTVSDRTIHPHYNPDYLDNDIALIMLKDPLVLKPKLVATVPLPSYSEAMNTLENERIFIVGWGTTGDEPDLPSTSNILKYRPTRVSDIKYCSAYYGNAVIETKLCAQTANGVSTCQGDSGGPVVAEKNGQYFLRGIVSFGASDGCAKGFPVVFTRVAAFLQFIEATTGLEIQD